MSRRYTPEQRLRAFLDKVEVAANGCWEWTAATISTGYGAFGAGGRKVELAHRWIYARVHGELDESLQVHHTCENPACVNPDHLEALPPVDHVAVSRDHNANKDECKHGHPFNDENTCHTKGGRRRCRTCNRLRARGERLAA